RVDESIVVREAFPLLFAGGVAVGIGVRHLEMRARSGFHWLTGLGTVFYVRLLYDYCLVEIKVGKKRCPR
ncbi:hypothetical protein QR685DRAFT_412060, partial [Neurospora intermedia]